MVDRIIGLEMRQMFQSIGAPVGVLYASLAAVSFGS
jgi:hypothetical protein